MYYLLFKCNWT